MESQVNRKKTIIEYKRPVDPHPIIAKIMREDGWVPLVVRRGKSMYWNGVSGIDRAGKRFGISSDTRAEFFREIHDGHFGNEAKQIIIDQPTYESIYDVLLDLPDRARIASEKLSLVKMVRAADGNSLDEDAQPARNAKVAVSAQKSEKASVSSLVAEIERRAKGRDIGRLQQIRKELKGKMRMACRSIFHQDTIREKDGYAFHY